MLSNRVTYFLKHRTINQYNHRLHSTGTHCPTVVMRPNTALQSINLNSGAEFNPRCRATYTVLDVAGNVNSTADRLGLLL